MKLFSRFAFFLAIALTASGVLGLSSGCRADAQGQMIRALSAKHKASLVTLSLVVKMSSGGYESQSEMEAGGILLDSSGLVATTNTAIDPMAAYQDEDSGSGMTSRVTGVKILLTNGQEIAAKVVLRDKDKNLAFLRPLKKPAAPLIGVNFQNSASAQIGEPIYLLGRMGKVGSRSLEAKTERVISVMDKPRRFYVLDAVATLYVGDVAFNEKGQPLGLVTLRFPTGKSRYSDSSLAIVIPARDVWEVARQAPQAKDVRDGTTPKATPKAPAKAAAKAAKP